MHGLYSMGPCIYMLRDMLLNYHVYNMWPCQIEMQDSVLLMKLKVKHLSNLFSSCTGKPVLILSAHMYYCMGENVPS